MSQVPERDLTFKGDIHREFKEMGLYSVNMQSLAPMLGVQPLLIPADGEAYDISMVKSKASNALHKEYGKPATRIVLFDISEDKSVYDLAMIFDRHTDPDSVWFIARNHVYFNNQRDALIFKLSANATP